MACGKGTHTAHTHTYIYMYDEIDPSQNLSTLLERPYKELLTALISFEIRLS